jgi:hypothetical protein
VIFPERDDMPVFKDEVSLDFDEGTRTLPQVLKQIVVLLVGKFDNEMFGSKTFSRWKNIIA